MNIERTRSTYEHDKRAKRPYRRLLLIGLSVVTLLFGSHIASFVEDVLTPSAKTPVSQGILTNVRLAWPANGQAAVGSVKDGPLARSSNNEKPLPMASMAKVVTALAIMEKQPFKLGQTGQLYTLTSKDVAYYHADVARGGSVVPVYEGMVLTQYQAMQMMLIASSNNISDTLAERAFGSAGAYESYAQEMLQRMGLNQTIIADASGFSPNTVSTPSELVTIGIAALKNPVIAEIVAQPQAQIPSAGTITNTNQMLGANGVIGIKTGTTDQAGRCLLFAARYTDRSGQEITVIGVIMGDKNATKLFSDSEKLLVSARQGFGVIETQSTDNVNTPPSWPSSSPS